MVALTLEQLHRTRNVEKRNIWDYIRSILKPLLVGGQYCLLVDIWEGQRSVDFAALKANGVAGVVIRLNDMGGGHHMDLAFAEHWQGAADAGLLRAPYFVYNPWVNGQANYDWLLAHMPADAKAVMVDVEVVYSGYSEATYAAEVQKFMDLVKKRWTAAIYTAEWFLPYLKYWPSGDYWWAQYPYALYVYGNYTWDWLRAQLSGMSGPSNAARCPGTLRMWQCSGDKLILPGSPSPMDVNVFYGTYADLVLWFGGVDTTPPPEPPPTGETMLFKVNDWAAGLKEQPTTLANAGVLKQGTIFLADEIFPDSADPNNPDKQYAHIVEVLSSPGCAEDVGTKWAGYYAVVKLQKNTLEHCRLESSTPPPDPPPSGELPYTVEVTVSAGGYKTATQTITGELDPQ